MTAPLPEPLQLFADMADPLAPELARVDATAARYRAQRAAGGVLPNTVQAVRIELTYHSNALEGNTLTLRETQLVIEGRSPAGERPLREVYEARNHDRALRRIEQWAAQRPGDDLVEADVLDVHGLILADIDDAAAGRFRSERVRISGTGYVPPGAHRFAELVPASVALANRADIHPVLRAAELHYNLVATHPFLDGNGRTARLMMNHLLLRHGYPYAVIEVGQRGRYLAALDEANRGRREPFAAVVVAALLRGAELLLVDGA